MKKNRKLIGYIVVFLICISILIVPLIRDLFKTNFKGYREVVASVEVTNEEKKIEKRFINWSHRNKNIVEDAVKEYTIYTFDVKYEVNGKQYNKSLKSNKNNIKNTNTLKISYNPTNPEDIKNPFLNLFVLRICVGIFGFLFLIGIVDILIHKA